MVFCTKCGAENPDDAKFCHRCGQATFLPPDRARPSVSLIIAALLLLVVIQAALLFVIPVFEAMFADFGAKLPWPTGILIAVSNHWKMWWWLWNLAVGFPLVRAFRTHPAPFNLRLALKIAILAQGFLIFLMLNAMFLPIFQLGAVAGGLK